MQRGRSKRQLETFTSSLADSSINLSIEENMRIVKRSSTGEIDTDKTEEMEGEITSDLDRDDLSHFTYSTPQNPKKPTSWKNDITVL